MQQWLTDISATRAQEGFDDGFDEAKKYFEDGNKILDLIIREHIKYGEMDTAKELQAFKVDFAEYYAIGKKMAKVYIRDGAYEGNKMMLELDPYAEKLANKLDKWVLLNREKNEKAADKISQKIDAIQMESLLANLLVVFILNFRT